MKFIILNFALILLSISSFAQNNPARFKSDIDFGNGTIISTFLDVAIAQNQFTITSPKNADARMVGGGKAKLARLLGKFPKKGRIITITGAQQKDSLFGDTNMPVFGKLKFKGIVKNETLSGELLNSEGKSVGTLQGVNSTKEKINFSELYPNILKTIKDNIYSKDALQTKGWKNFEKDFTELGNEAHDDIELFFGFNILARKLPFTHLTLLIGGNEADDEETPTTKQSVFLKKKTALPLICKLRISALRQMNWQQFYPEL